MMQENLSQGGGLEVQHLPMPTENTSESVAASGRWKMPVGIVLAIVTLGALWWIQPAPPSRLILLSRIEPPAYRYVPLREAEPRTQRLFAQAMKHYVAREFPAAISGLEKAHQIDPTSDRINFYLGASCLLSNQPEPAVEAFERVIVRGPGPLREEALLLKAKAHMRAGDANAARMALERLVGLQGALETDARNLLRGLQALS